ncbi:trypsin-like peptidase domain-containing protein [Candidatus Dojkabacteria bacterium]|nr:trypsin-like peptidase domain-containing protein [Candidatus Dojkabacteria bacterium]
MGLTNRSINRNSTHKNNKVGDKPNFFVKNSKLLVILGVILVVISVVAGGIFIFSRINKNLQYSGKITIDDADEANVDALASQIVYGSVGADNEYYSPNLDLAFTYNGNEFLVSDSTDYVFLHPVGFGSLNFYANLKIIDKSVVGDDVKQYYLSDFQLSYPDAEVVEDTTIGKLTKIVIKYTQASFLDENNPTKVAYHTILVSDASDQLIVMDIREDGANDSTESILGKFVDIINSVRLHPEDIDENIVVAKHNGSVSFTMNRSKWEVYSQTDERISLQFRSDTYEEKDTYKSAYAAFSLDVYPVSGEVTEDYASQRASSDLESTQTIYATNGFSLVSEVQSKKIGGIDFYYYQFEKNAFGTTDQKETNIRYFGYDSSSKILMEIRATFPGSDSAAFAECESILESISIDSSKTEDSSSGDQSVLGASSIQIDKAALIGKPAVVHLFSRSCVDVHVDSSDALYYSSGNTYTVCSAGLGSGFYVNSDGTIATNAHVAAPNPVDTAIDGTLYGYDPDELFYDLGVDALTILEKDSPGLVKNASNDELSILLESAIQILITDGVQNGYIQVSNQTYETYVQTDTPFDINMDDLSLNNTEDHYSTELVGNKEIDSFYELAVNLSTGEEDGISVPDLAVLKVTDQESNNFVAVELASSDEITTGIDIYVVGFPGSAEEDVIFSDAASIIPTVTTGTISAVKPNYDNKFDLVQMDASISHGNSGGPIFNSEGKVVGISTYGLNEAESADFNAGVSAVELSSFLGELGINNEVGEVSTLIAEGADDYSSKYYIWAVEKFEKAKELNPDVAGVLDPLINIANDKIDAGEDDTPVFVLFDIPVHKNEAVIVGIVVGALVLGIVLIILVSIVSWAVRNGRNKRALKMDQPQIPSSAQQIPVSAPSLPEVDSNPVAPVPGVSSANPEESVEQKNVQTNQVSSQPVMPIQPQQDVSGVSDNSAEMQSPTSPMSQVDTTSASIPADSVLPENDTQVMASGSFQEMNPQQSVVPTQEVVSETPLSPVSEVTVPLSDKDSTFVEPVASADQQVGSDENVVQNIAENSALNQDSNLNVPPDLNMPQESDYQTTPPESGLDQLQNQEQAQVENSAQSLGGTVSQSLDQPVNQVDSSPMEPSMGQPTMPSNSVNPVNPSSGVISGGDVPVDSGTNPV